MEDKKRLVVDVTTLLKWNRSPVGIIRTQLEFVSYLLENSQDALYFRFTDSKDQLIEVAQSEIQTKVTELLDFKNAKNPTITTSIIEKRDSKFVFYIQKVIYILRTEGLKSLLMKICKKKCPPKLKSYAKTIYFRFFDSNHFSTSASAQSETVGSILFCQEIYQTSQLNIPFLDKNSIVISMGLDWDYSNYPLLYWLKKKIGFEFVGSFYDGIPVVNPELVQSYYFSQKFFSHLYYLIHLSDRIFCISDFSKNQMMEICDKHNILDVPTLKTIHLGDSVFKNPTQENFALRKHKQSYVLYVSTIESRKNHILLLKVWQKLQQEKFADLPDLVLVGMMGWGIDDLLNLFKEDKDLQKVVHFYHDVDDDELVSIYKNARFTVFPSFVEGWGLGAVESMLYGKPCIISNCDALLEATQGLMPSASPTDIDTWSGLIKEFSTKEEIIESYKKIIEEKFQSRTWKDFSVDFEQFSRGEK